MHFAMSGLVPELSSINNAGGGAPAIKVFGANPSDCRTVREGQVLGISTRSRLLRARSYDRAEETGRLKIDVKIHQHAGEDDHHAEK